MPTDAKRETVIRLRAELAGSSTLVTTEYRGLTVKEFTELRRRLAGLGVSLRVVKNTLLKRALSEDQRGLAEFLKGPVAATFVSGDPAPVLKEMSGFANLV